MKSIVAAVLALLVLAGCGAVDEIEGGADGPETAAPTISPAPFVQRAQDPCAALPKDLPRVSDAIAEADRAELAQTIDDGKGVEAVGLTSCHGANVVIIGLSNDDVTFPSLGSGGTPVVTQRQGPYTAF